MTASLTQAEADRLLELPKHIGSRDVLELTTNNAMDHDWQLFSHDNREEFILTVERGRRNNLRVKYQTRARKVIVLARLDLNGSPHRNPPDQPYRPGELLPGSHLHLYREGFEDRVAYMLSEVPSFRFEFTTDLECLVDFLRFCRIDPIPQIQTSI